MIRTLEELWLLWVVCLKQVEKYYSSCVQMWELDHKEGWVVPERTLESPLDCKQIKPVNLKGNQFWKFEWLMLKLKLQYFGNLMSGADSLEKSLMLGKTEGKRRKRQQRMKWLNDITNSMNMNLSKLREMVKDREAWRTAVHAVTKSQTWLSNWRTRVR